MTNGLQLEQVTVSQSSNSPYPVGDLYVSDISISLHKYGDEKYTTVGNIVGALTYTKPNWIYITLSGSGESRQVRVKAYENRSLDDRSGSVVFKDSRSSTATMIVSQDAAWTIYATPESVDFPNTGGSETLTVYGPSAGGFFIRTNDGVRDWISTTISGTNVIVTATPNTSSEYRGGFIEIVNSSTSDFVPIAINQVGQS